MMMQTGQMTKETATVINAARDRLADTGKPSNHAALADIMKVPQRVIRDFIAPETAGMHKTPRTLPFGLLVLTVWPEDADLCRMAQDGMDAQALALEVIARHLD